MNSSLIRSKEGFSMIGATVLLGLLAYIKIPLFWTPIPLTLQNAGVMLIGALWGPELGFLTVLLYLCEGIIGFPCFAGGAHGCLYFVGPTMGYLLSMPITAYCFGVALAREKSSWIWVVAALLIQFILGAGYLSLFVGKHALALGVYPFLLGDIGKAYGVFRLSQYYKKVFTHRM